MAVVRVCRVLIDFELGWPCRVRTICFVHLYSVRVRGWIVWKDSMFNGCHAMWFIWVVRFGDLAAQCCAVPPPEACKESGLFVAVRVQRLRPRHRGCMSRPLKPPFLFFFGLIPPLSKVCHQCPVPPYVPRYRGARCVPLPSLDSQSLSFPVSHLRVAARESFLL